MAYRYKRSFTIQASQCGSSDSASFAVLVRFDATNGSTDMKTVANGGFINNTATQAGGNPVTVPADLVFTSDAGGTNKIPWEVKFYDPVNGALFALVTLSNVSHSANTVFYVFYGDATVTTQQNTGSLAPSNVWDTPQELVLLFPNGTTLYVNDSTANANNGSSSGATATAGLNDGAMAITSGNSVNVPNAASMNVQSGDFTISLREKTTASISYGDIFDKSTGATSKGDYALFINAGKLAYYRLGNTAGAAISGTAVLNDGAWHTIVWRRTGSSNTVYVDNVLDVSFTDASSGSGSYPLSLGLNGSGGGTAWVGSYDTFKVASTYRSNDWLTKEYNNQLNPESFAVLGSRTATATLLSLGDTFSPGDSLGVLVRRSAAETFAAVDVLGRSVAAGFSEAFAVADSLAAKVSKALADAFAVADSFAARLTKFLSLADAFAASDALARAVRKAVSDAAAASDSLSQRVAATFAEAFAATDSLSTSTVVLAAIRYYAVSSYYGVSNTIKLAVNWFTTINRK